MADVANLTISIVANADKMKKTLIEAGANAEQFKRAMDDSNAFNKFLAAQKEAEKVVKSIVPATEVYANKMAKLKELLDGAHISQAQFNAAAQKANDILNASGKVKAPASPQSGGGLSGMLGGGLTGKLGEIGAKLFVWKEILEGVGKGFKALNKYVEDMNAMGVSDEDIPFFARVATFFTALPILKEISEVWSGFWQMMEHSFLGDWIVKFSKFVNQIPILGDIAKMIGFDFKSKADFASTEEIQKKFEAAKKVEEEMKRKREQSDKDKAERDKKAEEEKQKALEKQATIQKHIQDEIWNAKLDQMSEEDRYMSEHMAKLKDLGASDSQMNYLREQLSLALDAKAEKKRQEEEAKAAADLEEKRSNKAQQMLEKSFTAQEKYKKGMMELADVSNYLSKDQQDKVANDLLRQLADDSKPKNAVTKLDFFSLGQNGAFGNTGINGAYGQASWIATTTQDYQKQSVTILKQIELNTKKAAGMGV